MIKLVRVWLARYCLECGRRKPMFTAVCDECWERYQ
jgi:hypothetical protein